LIYFFISFGFAQKESSPVFAVRQSTLKCKVNEYFNTMQMGSGFFCGGWPGEVDERPGMLVRSGGRAEVWRGLTDSGSAAER